MKWIFLSNYYTHHQSAFCRELDAITEHGFSFLETEEFSEERRHLGWRAEKDADFVKAYEASEDDLCGADAVILGSAPRAVILPRLHRGGLTFLYAERVFKSGYQRIKRLPRMITFWLRYGRYKNLYLLCASAYTAHDYGIHGAFVGKSYKWGYFPETIHYKIEDLMAKKDPARILWCGRFLDWKHPDYAIEIARRLKEDGYSFEMELIGTGAQEETLKKQVRESGLEPWVKFSGAVPPEEVRKHMELAGIYLFTSDFHEGWGAVLNESMNSGCAVVASHAIGAVPYLVKHRENGLIYQNGDVADLYEKVKYLLDHPVEQRRLGTKAYRTITDLWNGELAAQRLLRLAQEIQNHGSCELYDDGPCSAAPMLKNDWFKEEMS